MIRTSSVLAGLALTLFAAGAEAQSITPLRLGVALGTTIGENSWEPQGAHAIVSLTSQPADSRFGIRVEALFDGRQRFRPHPFGWGDQTTRHTTLGLAINGTYRLWGQRTGLYAIAGIGVYHSWSYYRLEAPPAPDVVQRSTLVGLGLNAGLGFNFTTFGRELFLESRLHSAAFQNRIPVSLGIRF